MASGQNKGNGCVWEGLIGHASGGKKVKGRGKLAKGERAWFVFCIQRRKGRGLQVGRVGYAGHGFERHACRWRHSLMQVGKTALRGAVVCVKMKNGL